MNRFLNSTDNNLNSRTKEEELALQAQTNNGLAFNILADLYEPIIIFKANKFKKLADRDDLVQEGLLGLWGAVQTYNPNKSASFKTYANKCIDNRILSGVNKANGKKHIPSELLVYLGSDELNQVKDNVTPEQSLIERENYIGFIKRIKSKLSKREFTVLSYHTAGKSYKQIAEILQMDIKAVDNAIQRIRKKLKY